MNKEVLEEVSTWKLEAKLEDTNRYFYHTSIVDKITSGSKSFVIGRKGTGKTALTEHLVNQKSSKRFSKKLSFKNFPFHELYKLSDEEFTTPNQYITIWKYLIYSSTAKLLINNENIDPEIRNRLNSVYTGDIEQSLSRTVKRWVSSQFKIGILGTGVEGGFSMSHSDNKTPWVERVEILEDVLLQYLDNSEYLIVFDELDEDYKDITIAKNNKQYLSLITSLFKAVQDIRSIFLGENYRLYPTVFLRDDIYDLLEDNDRNKWSDLKSTLDWDETKIKNLLAFRISRAISPNGKTMNFRDAWNAIFTKGSVKYGSRQTKEMQPFLYITRSTQLRPRDYIRYIQACSEETLDLNYKKIRPTTIKKIDKAFSNYLRNEMEDEIHGILPEIKKILDLFSSIRKQTLSIEEFKIAHSSAINNDSIPKRDTFFVLKILFHFSVIGNQPKQSNNHVFRYKNPEAQLNQNEKITVHRGLFKALQIL